MPTWIGKTLLIKKLAVLRLGSSAAGITVDSADGWSFPLLPLSVLYDLNGDAERSRKEDTSIAR